LGLLSGEEGGERKKTKRAISKKKRKGVGKKGAKGTHIGEVGKPRARQRKFRLRPKQDAAVKKAKLDFNVRRGGGKQVKEGKESG